LPTAGPASSILSIRRIAQPGPVVSVLNTISPTVQINIWWDNPPVSESGLAFYRVYRSGPFDANLETDRVTPTLDPNRYRSTLKTNSTSDAIYAYSVHPIDLAENETDVGNAVAVAKLDTTTPTADLLTWAFKSEGPSAPATAVVNSRIVTAVGDFEWTNVNSLAFSWITSDLARFSVVDKDSFGSGVKGVQTDYTHGVAQTIANDFFSAPAYPDSTRTRVMDLDTANGRKNFSIKAVDQVSWYSSQLTTRWMYDNRGPDLIPAKMSLAYRLQNASGAVYESPGAFTDQDPDTDRDPLNRDRFVELTRPFEVKTVLFVVERGVGRVQFTHVRLFNADTGDWKVLTPADSGIVDAAGLEDTRTVTFGSTPAFIATKVFYDVMDKDGASEASWKIRVYGADPNPMTPLAAFPQDLGTTYYDRLVLAWDTLSNTLTDDHGGVGVHPSMFGLGQTGAKPWKYEIFSTAAGQSTTVFTATPLITVPLGPSSLTTVSIRLSAYDRLTNVGPASRILTIRRIALDPPLVSVMNTITPTVQINVWWDSPSPSDNGLSFFRMYRAGRLTTANSSPTYGYLETDRISPSAINPNRYQSLVATDATSDAVYAYSAHPVDLAGNEAAIGNAVAVAKLDTTTPTADLVTWVFQSGGPSLPSHAEGNSRIVTAANGIEWTNVNSLEFSWITSDIARFSTVDINGFGSGVKGVQTDWTEDGATSDITPTFFDGPESSGSVGTKPVDFDATNRAKSFSIKAVDEVSWYSSQLTTRWMYDSTGPIIDTTKLALRYRYVHDTNTSGVVYRTPRSLTDMDPTTSVDPHNLDRSILLSRSFVVSQVRFIVDYATRTGLFGSYYIQKSPGDPTSFGFPPDFSLGQLCRTEIVPNVDFWPSTGLDKFGFTPPAGMVAARGEGNYQPPANGTYRFGVNHERGARLSVNGIYASNPAPGTVLVDYTSEMLLEQAKLYPIALSFESAGPSYGVQLLHGIGGSFSVIPSSCLKPPEPTCRFSAVRLKSKGLTVATSATNTGNIPGYGTLAGRTVDVSFPDVVADEVVFDFQDTESGSDATFAMEVTGREASSDPTLDFASNETLPITSFSRIELRWASITNVASDGAGVGVSPIATNLGTTDAHPWKYTYTYDVTSTASTTALTQSTQIALALGPDPVTTVTAEIRALDRLTNIGPSVPLFVVHRDAAPPNPVTNTFAYNPTTRVTLTWDNVSDVGLAGLARYRI